VKINMVVMAGINDDELLDFATKTIDEGWHVRFIELMLPVGVSITASQLVSVSNMRKRLKLLGELESPVIDNFLPPFWQIRIQGTIVDYITSEKDTSKFCAPSQQLVCFPGGLPAMTKLIFYFQR
ncbi:unnamed protein product, partial [marine sediment metagenome]